MEARKKLSAENYIKDMSAVSFRAEDSNHRGGFLGSFEL